MNAADEQRSGTNAARRIDAARVRLMMTRPFIGTLLAHLPAIASNRTATIATDTRSIHYRPAWIDALDDDALQFALAHETLHCALNHLTRRGSRLAHRWSIACDHAVNHLLLADGMTPVAGALIDERFRGLTAEAIYPMIGTGESHRSFDDHWYGAYAAIDPVDAGHIQPGDPPPVDPRFLSDHRDGLDEVVTRAPMLSVDLAADWDDHLHSGAHAARVAGQWGPHWAALVAGVAQARVPWRALLARFLASIARDDYSFQRPGRRQSDALLPGLAGASIHLAVALDTSGSISLDDLRVFAGEIDALKAQLAARVQLFACDSKLAAGCPWTFEPWEPVAIDESIAGGGTTSFRPVFEWMDHHGMRPDALVWFTDAMGEFPAHQPAYPVLWLVRGNAPVPWGQRVTLD